MTDKNVDMVFDSEALRKAFEGMGKVVAEVGFQLAAQGALGYLLQDQAERTGAILDRMTEEQRLRLWIAASALAGLAGVGLDHGQDDITCSCDHHGDHAGCDHICDCYDPADDQLAKVLDRELTKVTTDRDQWRKGARHYIGIVGRIEEYADQLDELAGPDRNWSVRATDTATKLRALITDDQPTKFETTGDLREQHDAHRRRLADVLDATPCRNWDQLLTLAEQTHDTAVREQAEAERLRALVAEILGKFVHRGHPGYPALQTGWIAEPRIRAWRAAITTTTAKDQPTP